jgi:hypothetical protein
MAAKKSAAAARRELLERIQTEGAQAGYNAALEVARDPKAASPAKATAAGLLLRAAGLLNVRAEDLREKEPSEMSLEELQDAAARFREAAASETDELSVFD